MSDTISGAVDALNAKLAGGFAGTAKFEIESEGTIIVDGEGARAGDGDADVTLSADEDTFRAMIAGDLNPASAFMSGKLKVDGDMGTAMRLAAALA